MEVVIAGGTGFVGSALTEELLKAGYGVTIVSRRPPTAKEGGSPRFVSWPRANDDKPQHSPLAQALGRAQAVINLAGAPIADQRWTPERKQLLLDSRVNTTRQLVQLMGTLAKPPAVLINSSAVGYYGVRDDQPVPETTPAGTDFLGRLCTAWEEEAKKARPLGVRTVRLRIGIVLGREGGALPRMLLPFKLFVGGPLGSGRQWLPWIHLDDVAGLFKFALQSDQVQGSMNAVAPQPVTNREFAQTVGRVIGRPSWLPAPAPALRLLLGAEMADSMLLGGQRAIPAAALDSGYKFEYEELEPALADVLTT